MSAPSRTPQATKVAAPEPGAGIHLPRRPRRDCRPADAPPARLGNCGCERRHRLCLLHHASRRPFACVTGLHSSTPAQAFACPLTRLGPSCRSRRWQKLTCRAAVGCADAGPEAAAAGCGLLLGAGRGRSLLREEETPCPRLDTLPSTVPTLPPSNRARKLVTRLSCAPLQKRWQGQ